MKKIFYLSAVALCAMASLASCENDDDFTPSTPQTGHQQEAAAKYITFADPFVGIRTRAEVTSSNITSQKLKVWADRQESGSSTWTPVFAGTNLTYTAGLWTPATQTPWLYDQNYRFMAIAPSTASATYDDGKIAIANIPVVQPVSSGTDYLVSSQTNTTASESASTGVNLTMKHILSKFSVEVRKTGAYNVYLNDMKMWLPVSTETATYTEANASGPSTSDKWTWATSSYGTSYPPTTTTHQQIPITQSKLFDSAGSVQNSASYFIAPRSRLYVFLDLNFEVRDASGNVIRSYNLPKLPVDVSLTQGAINKLVVTFDTDRVTNNISFKSIALDNWTNGTDNTATI